MKYQPGQKKKETAKLLIGEIRLNMNEMWKNIPDYKGYEVSDMGNVRSWLDYTQILRYRKSPRVLKIGYDHDGYRGVSLYKDKKPKRFKVATLVAITFIGPRPDGLVVCHKNGNCSDDRLENLEYKTQKENILDKFIHKTIPLGEKHSQSQVSNEQAIEIYCSNESHKAISKRMNIGYNIVLRIRSGETRKHLTKNLIKGSFPIRDFSHLSTQNKWRGVNEEMIIEIYTSNLPNVIIAQKFNIGKQTVENIRKEKTWTCITCNLTKGKYMSLSEYGLTQLDKPT